MQSETVQGNLGCERCRQRGQVALNVASGTLRQPMVGLRHYTFNALPGALRLNGMTLVQDVDYFPSTDDAGDALWLTPDCSLRGASTLQAMP